jgi:hypothetical protein
MRRRWQATATYRTATGPVEVVHDLAEVFELHDLIEKGRHWDTIIKIEIVRVKLTLDSVIDGKTPPF